MTDFQSGFNLGWLAAAVEYEGAVGVRVLKVSKKNPERFALHPYVEVYNTDKRLVQKIADIVGFGHVRTEMWKQKDTHKYKVVFALHSRSEILKFLEMIEPYLISKRERAQLLMEFCRSRLEAMHADDFHRGHWGTTPYSSRELELAKKIREIVTCESGSSRQNHVLAGF